MPLRKGIILNSDLIAPGALNKYYTAEEKAQVLTTYTYNNLLNTSDADFQTGKYITPSNGNLAANASYNTTGYIPVIVGDKINLTSLVGEYRASEQIGFLCAFNASKTVLTSLGTSYVGSYLVPDGVSFVRISYSASITSPMVEADTGHGVSENLLAYNTPVTKTYSPLYNVGMFLPEYIYVAIGETVEIYYKAVMPLGYGIFNIRAKISYGASTTIALSADKATILGVSAGTRRLRIDALDTSGNVVISRMTSVQCVAASTVTKSICPIGDSLTSGKVWMPEVIKYNNNITFVGSKSDTQNDSGGTPRSFSHQGNSGWSAKIYCTLASSTAGGSSEVNPFWDATLNAGAGGFSWAYYVANTLSNTAPNIVNIFLGQNGLAADPTENVGYIKQMVDNIRAVSATMPITLMIPQYRDYYKSSTTALFTYVLMVKLYEVFSTYSNLYIVPVAILHDSAHNYILDTEVVNPRSAITQPKVTDVTHPQSAGYYQFADAFYGVFSAKFTS